MATNSQKADQGGANLPAALLALTAVTGLIDAVSVLGFGVFTANMICVLAVTALQVVRPASTPQSRKLDL